MTMMMMKTLKRTKHENMGKIKIFCLQQTQTQSFSQLDFQHT